MKQFIEVRGARQNNLKNIDVDIPRDKLTVITGVSGSGKSSLAFEVIYGEGQRRLLESMSTFVKSRISQLKKPDVDYIRGLSPVIAIEQKKGILNPRSTVGTMTDIYDFMRVLFSSAGDAECPLCSRPIPIKSVVQMIEHIQSLPENTEVEVLAPVFKIYGEDYEALFDEIRLKGFRVIIIEGQRFNLSDKLELNEENVYEMEVVIDKVIVKPNLFKALTKTIENSLTLIGDGFIRFEIVQAEQGSEKKVDLTEFYENFGCPEHHITMGELQPSYFSFNDPASSCRTCGGLGTFMRAEPRVLMNLDKSMNQGALDTRIFIPSSIGSWKWQMFYSLAQHYGFSLDTPLKNLAEPILTILLYGTKGEKFKLTATNEVSHAGNKHAGPMVGFGGFVNQIDRGYKQYIRKNVKNQAEADFYKRVMIEHTCADCEGKKLKLQRFCIKIGGKDIHELCSLSINDLREFLEAVELATDKIHIMEQIIQEIDSRLSMLIDIGLGYLNLGRKSDSISGGEAQRIRLSMQISSGLMGMLYVLDEPSIGLHARDSVRIMNTLNILRDIGNTIIVVEHDMETIRNADHIIEIGPGPGTQGGRIIAQGSANELMRNSKSLTGAYMSGVRRIELPIQRRRPNGKWLSIRGARANNLRNVNVEVPLELLVCITGVSGSGKSTLINEVMLKQLQIFLNDARIVSGEHDSLEGYEHISAIIHIDQAPIGRNSRSNPATYIGFFDRIRDIFAESDSALEKGYASSSFFSFNSKTGGRCEHCLGEGIVTTQLQFMPDIESLCPSCKGARFNREIMDVHIKGKNIANVLDMSVVEASEFFNDQPYILHKLEVLKQLGLDYLKLGQSATTLSGGEAQRIKLAAELSKLKRGAHNLYILDEPTTGLHLYDIQKLIHCINQLVDAGHTVLIIEHHMDIIKIADYIIDLGPEGGEAGGHVVAYGTPEEVAQVKGSHTGLFLREILNKENSLHTPLISIDTCNMKKF